MDTLHAVTTFAATMTSTLATTAGGEPDLLRFFGRLHPLAVHFPVALILVALVFEMPTILRRNPEGGGHSMFAYRCLLLGALAAATAAWFGWLNADLEPHGRRLADDIKLHRWLGVATASLAVLIVFLPLLNRSGKRRWASRMYRLGLLLCAGTLAFGGHIGGELVFGEGYVTEPLFGSNASTNDAEASEDGPAVDAADAEDAGGGEDPAAGAPDGGADVPGDTTAAVTPADDRITFVTHIRPILAESCFHCHGPEKSKGGLRLHEKDRMFGPEREWWVVVPGDLEGSLLYELITKPAGDDELMPGDGDPLPEASVALIAAWIESGAEWGDESIAAASFEAPPAEDATEAPPAEVVAGVVESPSLPTPDVVDDAAVSAAIEAVQARGGVVSPIAQGSVALDVTYAVGGSAITDADLAALAGLEPVLAWLDLGRTSVTDAGVAQLRGHGELRRLHLERTAITDACLDDLAQFRHLRYLNLYGTAVTDAAIDRLAALEQLEQVYLWGTAVTDAGAARLAEARPDLEVVAFLDLPPLEETVLQILGTPAGCCADAAAGGGTCAHECCIAAAAAGTVCEKCGGIPAPDAPDAPGDEGDGA